MAVGDHDFSFSSLRFLLPLCSIQIASCFFLSLSLCVSMFEFDFRLSGLCSTLMRSGEGRESICTWKWEEVERESRNVMRITIRLG